MSKLIGSLIVFMSLLSPFRSFSQSVTEFKKEFPEITPEIIRIVVNAPIGLKIDFAGAQQVATLDGFVDVALENYLDFSVQDGAFIINATQGAPKNSNSKLTLRVPIVSEVVGKGRCNINFYIEPPEGQEIVIQGSQGAKFEGVASGEIVNISLTSGASMDIELNAAEVNVSLKSSKLTIAGTVESAKMEGANKSVIMANDLAFEELRIALKQNSSGTVVGQKVMKKIDPTSKLTIIKR